MINEYSIKGLWLRAGNKVVISGFPEIDELKNNEIILFTDGIPVIDHCKKVTLRD
jgi:hypothetical protein